MTNANFETGATTSAANNLILSVLNEGQVYADRVHIGFAMLQGVSHRCLTFRDLANNEAVKQRKQGSKFKAAEISEAAEFIQADTIQHCLETIRDEWNGEKIKITIRRWFDKVNGNSYWSARIVVPSVKGERWLTIPFSYGYGSHPEWESVALCEKIGLFQKGNKPFSELPVIFRDKGYMLKRDMFTGLYI